MDLEQTKLFLINYFTYIWKYIDETNFLLPLDDFVE